VKNMGRCWELALPWHARSAPCGWQSKQFGGQKKGRRAGKCWRARYFHFRINGLRKSRSSSRFVSGKTRNRAILMTCSDRSRTHR
jgi:hypothetical protein